jgi:hypothetical protein
MSASGGFLPALHHEIDPSNLYGEWLSRNFVWTPGAAMFRRQALEEIGGFPSHVGPAADYAVYLKLARTDRVRFIAVDLVRYRQHETSMSRDSALMLRSTLAVLRRERREAPASVRKCSRRDRKSWCDWYGEQIIDRLRADWHARRIGWPQVQGIATLACHCPRLALRHVGRKVGRVAASVLQRARLLYSAGDGWCRDRFSS